MVREEIVDGFQNAPHRSLYHALGLTAEEQRRPLIGIVSSYNEIVPGHMNLDKITEAVKLGVAMAGGTPIVFPAIALIFTFLAARAIFRDEILVRSVDRIR